MASPPFKSYFVTPVITVVQQATLIYLVKKLRKLKRGHLVFLRSLLSKDIIGDVGPSLLGTMFYRGLRYTAFGKRHKNTSALIAGLVFCSTSRRGTLKLLASVLASCWVFEVIKTWDSSKHHNDETKTLAKKRELSPWVFTAHCIFTGCAGGYIYFNHPKQSPQWFQDRVPIFWGHDLVKKGNLDRYRYDYMQHCSGHLHARESCLMSILARPPRCYLKVFQVAAILQIPALVMKRNWKKSTFKAHEFSLFVSIMLGFCGAFGCLGNAIFRKKGLLKKVYRKFHSLFIGALSVYLTSRFIIRNPYWDEYFGIWYGQVTLFCLMELLGNWSYVVVGALAINGLRRRIERSKGNKKHSKIAMGVLLESFCIGCPIIEDDKFEIKDE